jgi:tRNA(Ile)-lysidine synthase
MLSGGGAVLACVSGGADSMCMLDILVRISADMDIAVGAAHFNHMLRGDESERDMDFVLRYCHGAGIKCYVGSGDVRAEAARAGGGIEAAARAARYAYFREVAKREGFAALATAHTADDNAETVLLNLARGTGTRGLCGIPPVRDGVIRPLLCLTRADVEAYLAERGVPHIEDSSNSSDEYARNRVRHTAMPVLRSINPAVSANIARASELLRSDDDYIRTRARGFISSNCPDGCSVRVDELLALHPSVAARVIAALAGVRLSHERTKAVLRLCGRGLPSGEARLPGGKSAFREYGALRFGDTEAPRGFEPLELAPGARVCLETGIIVTCETGAHYDRINKYLTTFVFDRAKICGKLYVRPRAPGDAISFWWAEKGRTMTKTLKKLFIERRIPARERALVPVIADELGPLAVYGIGQGARCGPRAGCEAITVRLSEIDS